MTQLEFSLQHNLDVTSNTARKVVRFANWLVEWGYFKAVQTAYNARERLCCIAQQVYIWVVYSFCESRCSAVYMNSAVLFFSTKSFHDARPKYAQCTQFSDFHEEVSTHGEGEHHTLSDGVYIDVPLCQLTHVANGCCQCVSHFLYIVSAAISVYIARYEYCFKLWSLFFSPHNSMCHFIKGCV